MMHLRYLGCSCAKAEAIAYRHYTDTPIDFEVSDEVIDVTEVVENIEFNEATESIWLTVTDDDVEIVDEEMDINITEVVDSVCDC